VGLLGYPNVLAKTTLPSPKKQLHKLESAVWCFFSELDVGCVNLVRMILFVEM